MAGQEFKNFRFPVAGKPQTAQPDDRMLIYREDIDEVIQVPFGDNGSRGLGLKNKTNFILRDRLVSVKEQESDGSLAVDLVRASGNQTPLYVSGVLPTGDDIKYIGVRGGAQQIKLHEPTTSTSAHFADNDPVYIGDSAITRLGLGVWNGGGCSVVGRGEFIADIAEASTTHASFFSSDNIYNDSRTNGVLQVVVSGVGTLVEFRDSDRNGVNPLTYFNTVSANDIITLRRRTLDNSAPAADYQYRFQHLSNHTSNGRVSRRLNGQWIGVSPPGSVDSSNIVYEFVTVTEQGHPPSWCFNTTDADGENAESLLDALVAGKQLIIKRTPHDAPTAPVEYGITVLTNTKTANIVRLTYTKTSGPAEPTFNTNTSAYNGDKYEIFEPITSSAIYEFTKTGSKEVGRVIKVVDAATGLYQVALTDLWDLSGGGGAIVRFAANATEFATYNATNTNTNDLIWRVDNNQIYQNVNGVITQRISSISGGGGTGFTPVPSFETRTSDNALVMRITYTGAGTPPAGGYVRTGSGLVTNINNATNIRGAAGSNGNDGAAGDSLLTGLTAPASSLGKNGDKYIRVTTNVGDSGNGDFYTKANGAWTLVGNIKGADALNLSLDTFSKEMGKAVANGYSENGANTGGNHIRVWQVPPGVWQITSAIRAHRTTQIGDRDATASLTAVYGSGQQAQTLISETLNIDAGTNQSPTRTITATLSNFSTSNQPLTITLAGQGTTADTMEFRDSAGTGSDIAAVFQFRTPTASQIANAPTWAAGLYKIGDFVLYDEKIYFANTARTGADTTTPDSDSAWTELGASSAAVIEPNSVTEAMLAIANDGVAGQVLKRTLTGMQWGNEAAPQITNITKTGGNSTGSSGFRFKQRVKPSPVLAFPAKTGSAGSRQYDITLMPRTRAPDTIELGEPFFINAVGEMRASFASGQSLPAGGRMFARVDARHWDAGAADNNPFRDTRVTGTHTILDADIYGNNVVFHLNSLSGNAEVADNAQNQARNQAAGDVDMQITIHAVNANGQAIDVPTLSVPGGNLFTGNAAVLFWQMADNNEAQRILFSIAESAWTTSLDTFIPAEEGVRFYRVLSTNTNKPSSQTTGVLEVHTIGTGASQRYQQFFKNGNGIWRRARAAGANTYGGWTQIAGGGGSAATLARNTSTTVTDINNISQTGDTAAWYVGRDVANAPVTTGDISLLQMKVDDSEIYQTVFIKATGAIYSRVYDGNSWTEKRLDGGQSVDANRLLPTTGGGEGKALVDTFDGNAITPQWRDRIHRVNNKTTAFGATLVKGDILEIGIGQQTREMYLVRQTQSSTTTFNTRATDSLKRIDNVDLTSADDIVNAVLSDNDNTLTLTKRNGDTVVFNDDSQGLPTTGGGEAKVLRDVYTGNEVTPEWRDLFVSVATRTTQIAGGLLKGDTLEIRTGDDAGLYSIRTNQAANVRFADMAANAYTRIDDNTTYTADRGITIDENNVIEITATTTWATNTAYRRAQKVMYNGELYEAKGDIPATSLAQQPGNDPVNWWHLTGGGDANSVGEDTNISTNLNTQTNAKGLRWRAVRDATNKPAGSSANGYIIEIVSDTASGGDALQIYVDESNGAIHTRAVVNGVEDVDGWNAANNATHLLGAPIQPFPTS